MREFIVLCYALALLGGALIALGWIWSRR